MGICLHQRSENLIMIIDVDVYDLNFETYKKKSSTKALAAAAAWVDIRRIRRREVSDNRTHEAAAAADIRTRVAVATPGGGGASYPIPECGGAYGILDPANVPIPLVNFSPNLYENFSVPFFFSDRSSTGTLTAPISLFPKVRSDMSRKWRNPAPGLLTVASSTTNLMW
nr:hypothetical protein Iba_chr06cCG11410 [Ipomoea batatas]